MKLRLRHFTVVYLLQVCHSLSCFFLGDFILWKISSDNALSNNTSSSSDVESLPSMGEGKGSPIKASLLNCRDAAEEDEDDEDGKTVIRAVSKGGKPITPVMAEYV